MLYLFKIEITAEQGTALTVECRCLMGSWNRTTLRTACLEGLNNWRAVQEAENILLFTQYLQQVCFSQYLMRFMNSSKWGTRSFEGILQTLLWAITKCVQSLQHSFPLCSATTSTVVRGKQRKRPFTSSYQPEKGWLSVDHRDILKKSLVGELKKRNLCINPVITRISHL